MSLKQNKISIGQKFSIGGECLTDGNWGVGLMSIYFIKTVAQCDVVELTGTQSASSKLCLNFLNSNRS